MTFTQLEIYSRVVELGGFTAAAAHLSISQSAVSHAIASLERELGVQLLTRQGGEVEPTEIGGQLLIRAREIVGLADAMREEAANARGLQRGSLRVGSFGPTTSLKLLPAILDAFGARHPRIEVRVEEGDDDDVVSWLQDRRIDVGFVLLPNDRFEVVELVEDRLVAVVSATHPLATRSSVSLSSLCDAPFILNGPGCGPRLEPLFAAARLTPRIRYRVTQVLTLLGMVERGSGVAVLPELALPGELARTHPSVRTVPLNPEVKRRIGLATPQLRHATPSARAFMKVARTVARSGSIR